MEYNNVLLAGVVAVVVILVEANQILSYVYRFNYILMQMTQSVSKWWRRIRPTSVKSYQRVFVLHIQAYVTRNM